MTCIFRTLWPIILVNVWGPASLSTLFFCNKNPVFSFLLSKINFWRYSLLTKVLHSIPWLSLHRQILNTSLSSLPTDKVAFKFHLIVKFYRSTDILHCMFSCRNCLKEFNRLEYSAVFMRETFQLINGLSM
jgi:hypothetical protein